MTSPAVPTRTHWVSIVSIFLAACSLALHIGKAPPALPLLREDLSLSLTGAGSIVSTYSLLIALTGLLFGWMVGRVGYRRFAYAGIAFACLGSFLGAQAQSLSVLLLTRALEGLGWIIAVIAVPAILSRLATERDRPLVLGIWGAFVPVGTVAMLLLAPGLQAVGGWRLAWNAAGLLSLLALLVLVVHCRRHAALLSSLDGGSGRTDLAQLRQWPPYALGVVFLTYSFQYVAVTSFLPTYLLDAQSIPLETGSRWVAFVVVGNALGNMAAGWLLRAGVSSTPVLVGAMLCFSGLAVIVYADGVPLAARILAAGAFTLIGGLIPGALFATAPVIARSPAAIGLLVGLMLQAAGIGQWGGPLSFSAVIELAGHRWPVGGWLMLAVGSIGALAAWSLRGSTTRRSPAGYAR